MNIALIVFAGIGERMNSSIPKQFIKVNGKELVSYAINAFINNPNIDEIILVTHKDYVDHVKSFNLQKVSLVIAGGNSRQESVRKGLNAEEFKDEDVVLIHDGDRPLVTDSLINKSISLMNRYDAICPYIDHKDAIKEISNLGRTKLINGKESDVQTPQVFRYGLIKNAHNNKKDQVFSDDIGLIEDECKVCYLEGDKYNFKITTEKDLKYFEKIVCKK